MGGICWKSANFDRYNPNETKWMLIFRKRGGLQRQKRLEVKKAQAESLSHGRKGESEKGVN
jgi:hypothetical protein